MNAKSLGTLLRDWRIERNETQAEVAEAAGLSRKVVGNIERGDGKVRTTEVVKVCVALGRHTEELVLHWSKSVREELQKIENELFGSGDAGQSDGSGAPDGSTSGSIKEKVAKMGSLIQEIIHTSQEELIQKLQLQKSPASSPPPAAPKRPRSRVSRKGRVRPRDHSGR
jgi:DNA-binding XRE family transcriptional regulator